MLPDGIRLREREMTTNVWVLNGEGDFTTASNWLTRKVPGAGADIADNQGTIDVTTDVGAVNSVSLSWNGSNSDPALGGLSVIDGGALTITAYLAMAACGDLRVTSSSGGGGSSLDIDTTLSANGVDGGGPIFVDTSSGAGGASLKVGGAFNINGPMYVDNASSEGGSSVTVGGALTVGEAGFVGNLVIGPNDGSLSSATTVTVGGLSVFNQDGAGSGGVTINGGVNALATLDVNAPAGFASKGVLDQYIGLSGDALLEFASGQITTIDPSATLGITGTNAFVADAGATGANSALNGLTTIDGALNLHGGASASTGALNNSGGVDLESGASLTVGGGLTSTGSIGVGEGATLTADGLTNFSGATLGSMFITGGGLRAVVDITGAAGLGAGGHIEGAVVLQGNALLEFGSGQITTIDKGSSLVLQDGLVADAGSLTTNSALAGLSTVAGALTLRGTAVTTTVGMDVTGSVVVDGYGYNGLPPQSLVIGGALTNSGTLGDGENYGGETASTVTAKGLTNSSTVNVGGLATLTINGAASNSGVVNVGSQSLFAVTGVLSGAGTVNLSAAAPSAR